MDVNKLKIGIVEDEMVIARTLELTLNELGYNHCGPACTYGEAMELLEDEKRDLLLLDINLAGKKDGIDVAEKLRLLYSIPFIFLTANSDMATIERAKKVRPDAYIVKPFTKEELFAAIEIAVNNFSTITPEVATKAKPREFVFLKEGLFFQKVYYKDILFLESSNNYTLVHTEKNELMIRSPFSDFLESLPNGLFIRVHRSWAVSASQIDTIETEEIIVRGTRIPVSKAYRDDLLSKLGI